MNKIVDTETGEVVAIEKRIPKSIAKKIVAITAKLGNIPKRGHNKFHHYDYVLAADVVDTVRQQLSENGLVLVPVNSTLQEVRQTDKQFITKASTEYVLADSATGESFSISWASYGSDTGDKGPYKAYTGGFKYLLMQIFTIAGDDSDPENEPGKRQTYDRSGPDKMEGEPSSEQMEGVLASMKSSRDDGFCWACKQKHISKGEPIVKFDLPDKEGVWGHQACYLKHIAQTTQSSENAADGQKNDSQEHRTDGVKAKANKPPKSDGSTPDNRQKEAETLEAEVTKGWKAEEIVELRITYTGVGDLLVATDIGLQNYIEHLQKLKENM